MNFERQDIGLGLFVVGAAGAVIAALVLVLGAFRGESITLGVYVDSVANVRTGSAVFVSGYRVGELKKIEPVYEPSLRFRIFLSVDADFPLYEGTRAQIVAPGIIGDAIVNLQLPGRPSLRLTDGAIIDQAPSVGLTEIASRADSLARSLEGLSGRLTELLSPEVAGKLLEQVTRTLSSTTRTLNVVEDRFIALSDSLLYGMQIATQSVRLVSEVLNENRARISGTLDSTNVLVGELRGAMRSAGEFFTQERPRLERSLADLEAILSEMRTLSEDMNNYSLWQMLFKKRHEEPPE
jgi:ABC-type transporter Mla subunit MlaD